MKKVLHINKNREYSGAENVAMNICLLANKYEHLYASPKGAINEILGNNGVEHFDLEKFNLHSIEKAIREFKPDIIHAHDITPSILAALLSIKYKNIKIVSHVHNNDPKMKKVSVRWLSYTMTIPFYDEIIVVSESVKSEYLGGFVNRGITLPNIVNPNILPHKQSDISKEFDIVTVARLVEQKRPEMFLELVSEVKKVFPNIRAAYVGDGDMKEKFLKLIEINNLKENVTFVGFQTDPYQYLAKSKVFALTSSFEGFGLVALEALAYGLPTVVTHVGGLPTIVNSSVGISSNELKELSNEIIKLLSDDSYYNEKSLNAKNRFSQINDINKFVEQLDSVYN